MENDLTYLIGKFKNNKNEIIKIIEKLSPLINKYVRLLYKEEKEDMKEEFIMAIYEALIKMEYYEKEGQCLFYLEKSIKNKFLELYRKSKKRFDYEITVDESFFQFISYDCKEIEELIFKEDFNKILTDANKQTYKILYSSFVDGLSDAEIGKLYNVSRQYVHRIRKKYLLIFENM